jgi:hypothetical protein
MSVSMRLLPIVRGVARLLVLGTLPLGAAIAETAPAVTDGATGPQGVNPAPALNSAYSRKVHGAVPGAFDLPLTLGLLVCPPVTGAGTLHSALVPGEHWTEAGNPHIITFDVSLASGTLTLDPCVVVRVREGYNIRIGTNAGGASASIVALGTPTLPIIFESENPVKYWGSLRILATGHADLENVTLRHAGNPANSQALGGALQVIGDGAFTALTRNARVKNVRIETSATMGLNLQQAGGLTADSSGLVIVDSGRAPGIVGAVGGYAVYVNPPAINTLPPGTYTGNAKDEILVDDPGNLSSDETFRNLGVPYRMRYGYSQVSATPSMQGGLSTLVIEAGVTIKFLNTVGIASTFNLGGYGGSPADVFPVRLIANGTLTQPIVFTSAAAVPAAGDWGGIEWKGGPDTGNVMNFVRVEYAGADSGTAGFGCGPNDNDAALIITNWVPGSDFVQNSTFSNSATGGIVMGWISAGIRDFKTNNTFTAIGNGCAVARWQDPPPGPACPAPRPMCF